MDASTSSPPLCHDSISDKKHGVTVSTEEKFSPTSSSSELGVLKRDMDQYDIEKSRDRRVPACFKCVWIEVGFVGSLLICLSMAEFVISGFQVLLPALVEPLDIPEKSKTWPSSVLTLVVGALLFPMGRVADIFGPYPVFNVGMLWFLLWTAIAGGIKSFKMLVVCRAMEGLGASAFLPAGIALLSNCYPPGRRKNFVFSLYGALAPIGFFLGILTGGLAHDLLSWRWYFYLGAIVSGLAWIGVLALAPDKSCRMKKVQMDWWGMATMIPGLILVVYALTDSSRAPRGWASPHIIACMVIGVALLAAAVYIEGWVAEAPLIPFDIFRIKYMKRMILSLFLTWGVFAIYLFYACFYIQNILNKSPLISAVWFAPWAAGGFFLATISGLLLHIIPGRWLLILSSLSKFTAVFLFYLMPDNPTYWAWVFPAMLAETTCTDVLWTVSNVFLTTSLPKERQGLAGALINISLFLGCAFFLAIADVAIGEFEEAGWDLKKQYKMVFLIGSVIAAVVCIICCTMGLKRATSQSIKEEEEVLRTDGCEVPRSHDKQEMGCVDVQTGKVGFGLDTTTGEASSDIRTNKENSEASVEELREDSDTPVNSNSSNFSGDESDKTTSVDNLIKVSRIV